MSRPVLIALILAALGVVGVTLAAAWWLTLPESFTITCSLRGNGDGECEFRNKGLRKGQHCGHVELRKLDGSKTVKSPRVCSGQVSAGGTREADFEIHQTFTMCVERDRDFDDVCAFEWRPED